MKLDGVLADVKLAADELVGEAVAEEIQDLPLRAVRVSESLGGGRRFME